jgi:ankyrin repeat protein
VKAGASLKYGNPDGITPLMIAVMNDQLDLAAMLVEMGADPNDGSLYETVQLNNLRINSTAGDATRPRPSHSNKLTPLDLMSRLLDAGADPARPAQHTPHLDGTGTPRPVNQSAMALASGAQDVSALRVLLSKGANANQPLENGVTPLIAVIDGGAGGGGFGFGVAPGAYRYPGSHSVEEAVQLLVQSGAGVKAVTPSGDTALHSAAQSGNLAVIRFLAEHGAPLAASNKAGLTPLDIAMGKRAPNANGGRGGRGGGPHPEAVQLLRQLIN